MKQKIRILADNADGAKVKKGDVFTASIDKSGTAETEGTYWCISSHNYELVYENPKSDSQPMKDKEPDMETMLSTIARTMGVKEITMNVVFR